MNSPSGNTGIDPVQLILEEIIRSSVAQEFPRKAVAPGLDLSYLLIGVAVDPFPLGDESADHPVLASLALDHSEQSIVILFL